MSSKGKVIVLKRLIVGDEDLLVKIYGWGGIMNLFVKDGAVSNYSGVFEPFNLLELTYKQSGEIVVPLDVGSVEYLSYLALEDYERYVWMCSLTNFFLRWIRHYDQQLFNIFLIYLSAKVTNRSVFFLKFKLEVLKTMGLYKDTIFEKDIRHVVKTIEEGPWMLLERIKLSKDMAQKIDSTIEAHLEHSL
jgi:recombinational DNA repair protein (RecF pathway)